MIETVDLLASYPRTRPPLKPDHERIYATEYKLNRSGGAVVERIAKDVEGWMHRRIAAVSGSPTLELGAGTLNHLRFEANLPDYDVVEPFTELWSDSPRRDEVRAFYRSQAEIRAVATYERIISIAVLEHMTDLPRELALSARLLRPTGVLQAAIPSEGGLLWWLGWRCTTGVSYWLRNRLDYGVVMRHEHVNDANEIETLVRHCFREVRLARYPTPFLNGSLYTYLEARAPDVERCTAILASRETPGATT